MMDVLQGVGYGIVGFALIVVIGTVVISKLGDSVAECATGFEYSATSQLCVNATNATDTASATGTGYTNSGYLTTQLGSSGLAGWIPAVIAVAIGALFLSYFMGRRR